MSGPFTRRYTFDPGLAEILKIEGVVIIDREVPGNTTGETTGATILVAEFEDGPYNTPIEIAGGDDQVSTFGAFGFTQDGLASSNPCARARRADSAINPEYWNGNGFLAISQKTYPRLMLVRVDTSVGAVNFTRTPFVLGNANFAYTLGAGQTAIFQTAFATTSTATFSAAAALLTTTTGSYPTGFTGGESFNVTIDGGTPLQIGPVDVVMTAVEQSQVQVLARINAVLGYTCAVTSSGTVFTMVGRVLGNTSSVVINSVSGGTITSKLGLTAAQNAVGTGNVGNISQVSFAEVKIIIQAAVAGAVVDKDSNGNLRVSHTTATELLYTSASTADGLGIIEAQAAQVPSGFAYLYATGTYPVTLAGGETLTLGFDGDQNVTVTFPTAGATTQATFIAAINAAFSGFTAVATSSGTVLRFQGHTNGGQVRIVAGSAAVLTGLGLTLRVQTATLQQDTVIPAGTRVRTAAGLEWLTTQSTNAPFASVGPYSCKVRPSLDDGTVAGATLATVTTLFDPVPLSSFAITNPLALSVALAEAAIDAAYITAMNSTLSPSSVAAEANFIVSARQSNACRLGARQNANAASFTLRGRTAVIRPPLGTSRAVAKSSSTQPGVGATADERVYYAYPGENIFIPQIAARGTAGGAGFTASGFIDLGSDTAFASLAGLLPPEQNAGQETEFMTYMNAIEVNNPDVQNLTMQDYIAFKAAGIVAPRIQDGLGIFQSDVTSYPVPSSSKADGPRRRAADFIEDSLAIIAGAFSKKPMNASRRGDVYGQFVAFGELLMNRGDPENARIDSYNINASKAINPQAAMDAGAFRLKSNFGLNPDMLDIVVDATIKRGSVDITTTT